MRSQPQSIPRKQQGFLYAYMISALAVAGVLVVMLGKLQGADYEGRLINAGQQALLKQIEQIRGALNLCAIAYPLGNNGTAYYPAYPATPGSGSLKDVICPGLGQNLWTSRLADNLGAPPAAVGDWTYANGATGIRISASSTVLNDTIGVAILSRVAARLGANEYTLTNSGNTLTVILKN